MTDVAAPYAAPLGGATVSGTLVTVDTYVNPPTIIPEVLRGFVKDQQGYFIEDLFQVGGFTVSGGAVIVTDSFPEDLFLDPEQSIAPRAPGADSPLIGAKRKTPRVVRPESWSGKIEVYDESRRRNDVRAVQNVFRKAANTFADRMQTRGIETLNDAIDTWSRDMNSVSWADAASASGGVINVARTTQPEATFAAVIEQFVNDKAGVRPDTVILNPGDALNLRLIFGDRLKAFLDSYGISNMHETPLQEAGKAIFAKGKQVGMIAFEKPLDQEYQRGPAGTYKDVFALEMVPVFIADDASAVLRATGLAA